VLEEIRIRGLGVISDAVLEFGPGLTVVTGETGAGKTMVLSGLALLFGGRADYSRVRPGAEAASVEGRLSLSPGSSEADQVTEAGGDLEAGSILLLRRVVGANGRSRAVAGGATVPAAVLTRLADGLLAVHGQSDQQRLTQPVEQRATLDRYAEVDLTETRAAFERWRGLAEELHRRLRDARELELEAELLRHGIAEIAGIAPLPGEDVELAAQAARLEHVDALRLASRAAHNLLLGDRDDPTSDTADVQTLLGAARRALGQVAGTDAALDELATGVSDLLDAAGELGAQLADYELALDADPGRLAAVHERRAALTGLLRKYGADLAAVLDWAEQASLRLENSDTSEQAIATLRADLAAAERAYLAAALSVSERRRAAAERLSKDITTELAGLAMAGARVIVQVGYKAPIESLPTVQLADCLAGAGPDGLDQVDVLLKAHPEAPALPVQRGASGGELSRVMLAIEVVLAGTDPVPTMVFDEVDAGVGGRAAVEVGRRLAQLSLAHQVIVVTHLAQVAAFADAHLVVDKRLGDAPDGAADGSGGVTRSDIRTVVGKDRLAELARMLAGDDTPVARKHAAELLASAAENRADDRAPGRSAR
jgi:DNA repair protein RecN (Recombination protein N)